MTRDVRIQESGTNQDFEDVKTVTTPVVGGGNATWMPEDETAVGEITITSNGEFVPSEHDLYGFCKVNVIVPGGGQGEYVEPGGIGINVDGTIPITQPNGTVSNVHVGTGVYTPPPAGIGGTIDGVSVSGGTIAGIDPDTGDYVQYTVTDSNGVPTLVKTTPQAEPRPASIRILTPPNKVTYEPGGLILFSGLTVGVYDQNGNPFTAPALTQDGHTYGSYDGTVPFYELSFPVKYASASSETEVITPGKDTNGIQFPLPYNYGKFSLNPEYSSGAAFWRRTEYEDEDIMYIIWHTTNGQSVSVSALSKKPNKTAYYEKGYRRSIDGTFDFKSADYPLNDSYTYDNKTVYYAGALGNEAFGYVPGDEGVTVDWNVTPSFAIKESLIYGSDFWAIMYGETNEGGLFIPVEWTSPYDGITYGDHFKISVKAQESNSGTGGGGGGHSF